MFTTTMRSLSAVLALGLILSLAAPSQASPLAGVYWSAQGSQSIIDGSNEANIYYAPFRRYFASGAPSFYQAHLASSISRSMPSPSRPSAERTTSFTRGAAVTTVKAFIGPC